MRKAMIGVGRTHNTLGQGPVGDGQRKVRSTPDPATAHEAQPPLTWRPAASPAR